MLVRVQHLKESNDIDDQGQSVKMGGKKRENDKGYNQLGATLCFINLHGRNRHAPYSQCYDGSG